MAGPNAVQFGGPAYLTAGSLAGVVDSKQVLGSLWLKTDSSAFAYLFGSTSERAAIYFFSGELYFLFRSPTNQDSFFGTRPGAMVADGAWHHLCFSTNGTSGACFFDDVPYSPAVVRDNVLDFTVAAHAIGAHASQAAQYPGALAQFYMNYGTYLDLTVTANRRKLVGPGANSSIDMGSDGSLVTGSPPTMFFDGATDDWHVNKGTAGGFTENGPLTTASVLPPEYYVLPAQQVGVAAMLMGL